MIVGLGNPGKKYEDTRHNVGFMALDLLCDKYKVRANNLKYKSLCAQFEINGCPVLALKPQTYMNLSGEAVAAAASAMGIEAEKVLVIFDDAALVQGRIRLRQKGSDGGHNGIKSIIYHLQSDAFPRIKIGIGGPDRTQEDMADFVLSTADRETVAAIKDVPQIVEDFIARGIDFAMQKYNGKGQAE